MEGLSTDSLIAGNKSTIFALFYCMFEGNFPSTSPRGAYIWRGDLTEGFLRYRFGGFIFGGDYTWRGLFSLCIWGQFFKYKPPEGLYLEGRFNGGFFGLPDWGAYIWRGLYMEGLIFGILR